jgi:U4/U6 small nuclear ribonucleoprotein PRP3
VAAAAASASAGLLRQGAVSSLILHPRRLAPRVPVPVAAAATVILTPAERAKQRHIARQERARETQDLIRAGVLPVPEPRYTLSNFMRVAGAEGVVAPTALEAKAKAQIAARQVAHLAANAARQLTPQERAEKLRRKWADPEGTPLEVRVFRVGDLRHWRRRLKVERNAKQYDLTGCLMLEPECNVVVVEGYPTALRKYSALLLRRIKWAEQETDGTPKRKPGGGGGDGSEDDDDESAEGATAEEAQTEASAKATAMADANASAEDVAGSVFGAAPQSDSVLLWRGVVSARAFRDFTLEGAGSRASARAVFERAGVPQYWDLAVQHR